MKELRNYNRSDIIRLLPQVRYHQTAAAGQTSSDIITAAGQTSSDCCRRSDIIRLLPQVRHHQIAAAGQTSSDYCRRSDIIRLIYSRRSDINNMKRRNQSRTMKELRNIITEFQLPHVQLQSE